MTTRFVLVRHGTCAQTAEVLLGRTLDAPLDGHGVAQVRAVGVRLATEHPRLVECSPRRRARETGAAVALACGAELLVAPALDEVDFGEWGGQRFDALETDARWRDWNAHRGTARTPAGDSFGALQARIVAHMRALARAFPHSTLVLVTHAEPIRAALLHFLERPADDWSRHPIAPASLTTLRVGRDGARIVRVDERVAA